MMGWYYYAAAAVVKVASEVQKGNSAAASYEAQARIARHNRRAMLQQGSSAEDTQRRQNALKMGEQRAAAAQSGFDSSSGSMATLQSQSAGELELDALTTRYEAVLKSIGYENDSSRLEASASAARTSGWLGGAASAILMSSQGGGYGSSGYNYNGDESGWLHSKTGEYTHGRR